MIKVPMITPSFWLASKLTRMAIPVRLANCVLGSVGLYTDFSHTYVMDDYGNLEDYFLELPYDIKNARSIESSTVVSMDDFGSSWHWFNDENGSSWIFQPASVHNVPHSMEWEDNKEPGSYTVRLGVPLKAEHGWNVLHQHTVNGMAVVRWLNLFGKAPSTDTNDMVEFELFSSREVAAESFPIEIGSLLARRRFLSWGEFSLGLVYNTESVVRKAYVGDCESYFDTTSNQLVASAADTYCEEGWDSLRSVWNHYPADHRWNVWYTEVFVQRPKPVAVVYYGKDVWWHDQELLDALEAFGLPAYQLDPCFA